MTAAVQVAYWVRERELIRLQREAGRPAPWTEDPILRAYRFCNVRREDDRVTRWLAQYWRAPYAQHPLLCVNMALARYFNRVDTLRFLGYQEKWVPVRLLGRLLNARSGGATLFHNAYMISTCGASRDKLEHVVGALDGLARALPDGPAAGDTLEGFCAKLRALEGFGPFLSGQIIADLKHAPGNPLDEAPDFWSWAVPGPGSQRGLCWYFGRRTPFPEREFLPALNVMASEVGALLAPSFRLEMQDWQNVMCEVSKYQRILATGRGRRRYNPTPPQEAACS